jgi:phospholipase/carboxylesterase
MSDLDIRNHYEATPAAGGAPRSLVVLLHGLGSNGRDLFSLVPEWAGGLPETAFISPDAPFPCDMVPPGYPDSFQWFSLQDRDPSRMREGAAMAAPILMRFLKKQMERFDLESKKVALVGFSQGTMMSLYTAPRFGQPLAGVLGYSGALLGGEELGQPGMHKCPVELIHGQADEVVPVGAYYAAKEALESNGFTVGGHVTPFLTHSIDHEGLRAGAQFLKTILS